jgi:hypothetical protein
MGQHAPPYRGEALPPFRRRPGEGVAGRVKAESSLRFPLRPLAELLAVIPAPLANASRPRSKACPNMPDFPVGIVGNSKSLSHFISFPGILGSLSISWVLDGNSVMF